MAEPIEVKAADKVDGDMLRAHVVTVWHADSVVAHGERLYPAELPGFVAVAGSEILGHASYRIADARCELTSIDATLQWSGIGTRLLEAVVAEARAAGCRAVWLTTTNDNLDALRFYQRRGFTLRTLRVGAVDRTRATLKPEVPAIGSFGISMRDELDLEFDLTERP